MAGLLSGLTGLGLKNLEDMNIFEDPKKDKGDDGKPVEVKIEEKDLLFDKTFECPVCDKTFTAKMMRSGKARLLGTDQDLRPKYEFIDPVKYDVAVCPNCGYAALTRFVAGLSTMQLKLIKENISKNIHMHAYDGETYTYEEALERYQLALVNAVVRHGKASEKAYICLKSAWLIRGWAEDLTEKGEATEENLAELKAKEDEFLMNAYNGFTEAVANEAFPMCGMDEPTMNYLLAVLAKRFKKYDVASKMIALLLTGTNANNRMKDKARDLKEEILEELKKDKAK